MGLWQKVKEKIQRWWSVELGSEEKIWRERTDLAVWARCIGDLMQYLDTRLQAIHKDLEATVENKSLPVEMKIETISLLSRFLGETMEKMIDAFRGMNAWMETAINEVDKRFAEKKLDATP